jgi:hypothetical protein
MKVPTADMRALPAFEAELVMSKVECVGCDNASGPVVHEASAVRRGPGAPCPIRCPLPAA